MAINKKSPYSPKNRETSNKIDRDNKAVDIGKKILSFVSGGKLFPMLFPPTSVQRRETP